jgi:Tfp pilus assembly major pilin PilA
MILVKIGMCQSIVIKAQNIKVYGKSSNGCRDVEGRKTDEQVDRQYETCSRFN